MAILVVGGGGELGVAVVRRLTSQGDDVRVVAEDSRDDTWLALGARVARGLASDSDLVERAAQDARSIVLFAGSSEPGEGAIAVLEAARRAGVERVIVVCRAATDAGAASVEASTLDHVVIVIGRSGGTLSLLKKRRASRHERVAEAVDAADDLAGHPRMVVDLADTASLRQLGLEA